MEPCLPAPDAVEAARAVLAKLEGTRRGEALSMRGRALENKWCDMAGVAVFGMAEREEEANAGDRFEAGRAPCGPQVGRPAPLATVHDWAEKSGHVLLQNLHHPPRTDGHN